MGDSAAGVYTAKKKDGSIYYRSSVTYKNKHISLGSFDDEETAHKCYLQAQSVVYDDSQTIDGYRADMPLSFDKYVVLVNFRDNEVYIPNPIYVRPKLFYYYFGPGDFLIFSREDLFYYSAHKIQRRGGHLFVTDYGSQINILGRYGIRAHAVPGKDYVFINGNPQDMQYSNIEVINPYHGVRMIGDGSFETRIHINGYTKVGIYEDAVSAAIAYNKASDILREQGSVRDYATNYIEGLSPRSYAEIYTNVKISDSIGNCFIHSRDA